MTTEKTDAAMQAIEIALGDLDSLDDLRAASRLVNERWREVQTVQAFRARREKAFKVGDRVRFKGRRGMVIVGHIKGFGPKRATVETETLGSYGLPQSWRVNYASLELAPVDVGEVAKKFAHKSR